MIAVLVTVDHQGSRSVRYWPTRGSLVRLDWRAGAAGVLSDHKGFVARGCHGAPLNPACAECAYIRATHVNGLACPHADATDIP
jgi:hypothetical protein